MIKSSEKERKMKRKKNLRAKQQKYNPIIKIINL